MAIEERRIQVRRDTAANWESYDPVLASGEYGYDETNDRYKVGNGTDAWTARPWSSLTAAEIEALDIAPTDHTHSVDDIEATGTPSSSTYLRGDGSWATPEGTGGGGGDVPSPHAIGGVHHSEDTLASLNAKISDANLDDSSATRTPATHGNEAHSATFVDAAGASAAAPVQSVNGMTGAVSITGYAHVIVQTSAGGAVEARPSTSDFPSGKVFYLLHDAPFTTNGPDDVESFDLVFNISGTAW